MKAKAVLKFYVTKILKVSLYKKSYIGRPAMLHILGRDASREQSAGKKDKRDRNKMLR